MKTYRYRGHSMSDPAKYRTREEVTEMREKRDPIEHFGKKLIERGVVSEDDLKQMDKRGEARSWSRPRNSPPKAPNRAWPNSTRTYTPDVHRDSDACACRPPWKRASLPSWLVKEGDTVKSGDILAEIETDKATMEFEAVDEGSIGKILVRRRHRRREGQFAHRHAACRWRRRSGAAPAPRKRKRPSRKQESEAPTSRQVHARRAEGVEVRQPIRKSPKAPKWSTMTVRDALRDAMAEEMRRDDLVFLMGEEVAEYQGAYKISQGLLQEFGDRRVIDTPITEHGFTGLGVGAAFDGLKPIVEFMTWNFAMQAMDQIINSAAKTRYMSGGQMSCPIVFRGPNGAAARVAAQHSQDYSAWYARVPGMKVIAPYFAADAKGLLKAAIRDPNPVIFLENEIVYGRTFPVPKLDDFVLPIGKARIVRPGKDVTIVAYSITVGHALEAAEKLAEEGIDAEVIDLRTLRPLDIDTVMESR